MRSAEERGCKPEAQVEAEILFHFGRYPGLILLKNETGRGFTKGAEFSMKTALARFGPAAVATALSVLQRHTITWGLGEGGTDLVGAYLGEAVCLEVKADDGVVSPAQTRWHNAARNKGVVVEVVRTIEEVEGALEQVRQRRAERAVGR